jgi:hypothetical protein
MISAKEAAKKALDYFFEMNALVGLTKEEFKNLMIDEVDADDDGTWVITIGYELPPSMSEQIIENPVVKRQYRKITVGNDGQVKGMRIGILANEE